ncbi:MAG TPA: KpsF/GutQ family sugar-phosphate isomerase [Gammaproteobacteria bacterium]|nr:KpsF/GutQ family sugar-phosphate isomerase [Gammaproteobacteria bacterium]
MGIQTIDLPAATVGDDEVVSDFHAIAVESLEAQSEALKLMASRIDAEFDKAVNMIMACSGRVIISGMGKSGLVGKKMAATFASTGTPSFFIHPAEAFHGDLGMITPDDLVLLISYSGETEEVTKLLPSLKHFGNHIISLTAGSKSTLARHSDAVLDVSVEREVCPNNLAPTTSTMATMGMGDALAVALINARNFKPNDFARYHPGGSLGKRLLTTVGESMTTRLPKVSPETTVHECLFTMTSGRLGLAVVMEGDRLVGVITDGDLRRAMLRENNLLEKQVIEFASLDPVTIEANRLLSDAEDLMRRNKIRVLVVTGSRQDDPDVVGILEIFD